jgi:hypothetical protein
MTESKYNLFNIALKNAKPPIIIALFLTPIRFTLEKIGLSENVIFIIGLLWLTLGFSIYWGIKLHKQKSSLLIILLSLVLFSPISRIPVFILWWITKTYNLGSHYDIFDNWTQALVGQLFYGSLVQTIPGFLVGAITIAIMKYKTKSAKEFNSKKNE